MEKFFSLSAASYVRVFASLLLLMFPLILITSSDEIRSSISDYYYSDYKMLFKGVLVFTSLVYISESIERKKWYNSVIGASLLGIAFLGHKDYVILHYMCAGIFFIGGVIVWIVFSSRKQRLIKAILSSIIITILAIQIITQSFSLLLAESLCFLPKVIHLIGEEIKILD